jgi:hypothetical protein
VQKTTRGVDPEVQKRILEGMVNHIREELRRADFYAKSGDLDAVQRRLDRLRDYVKQRPLPPPLFNEMKEAVRRIEIDGHRKLIDITLEKASDSAKIDDKVAREAHIKTAREHLSKAIALGAGEDFQKIVENKIEIVLLTDSGKDTGSAPKQEAEPMQAENKAQVAKPKGANETRRFKRNIRPLLDVEINGASGKTTDWSLGGLAFDNYSGSLAVGKKYDIVVRVEGDGANFKDTCEVVKFDGEGRKAIIRFLNFSSATLLITQKLQKEGKPITEEP